VKLTTHLQLVPRSRKCGSIHTLPQTPPRRSAELVKHRENFTFLYKGRIQTKVGHNKDKLSWVVYILLEKRSTSNNTSFALRHFLLPRVSFSPLGTTTIPLSTLFTNTVDVSALMFTGIFIVYLTIMSALQTAKMQLWDDV
jgi:hypothetical protein